MATQFGFYLDADLTQKVDENTPIELIFNVATGDDVKEYKLWFGSPDPNEKVVSADGETIKIYYEDTDPSNEHDITESTWRIAATQADLNNVEDNTPYDTGKTEIKGGKENAISFWVRRKEPQGNPGVYTDFVIRTSAVVVQPVDNSGG